MVAEAFKGRGSWVVDLKVGIESDVSCTTRKKEVQRRYFVPGEEGATMPCNFAIISSYSVVTAYLRLGHKIPIHLDIPKKLSGHE